MSYRSTLIVNAPLRRGGPRSYLHTTGVTASDAGGMTVSSLLSLFDDFGSSVFVPETGFALNNRAAGFTSAPNEFEPGKRPVHTLAPILLDREDGPLGLATPGADGQVQILLQVLMGIRYRAEGLDAAIAAPRWRSDDGRLLVERSHSFREPLKRLGHDVVAVDDGDERMGAVVAAGLNERWPVAAGDWRREVASGVI